MRMSFVYFMFLTYAYVTAMTDEEMMMKFTKSIMGCNSANTVGMPDLLKLQNLEIPTKSEVKCLLACAYRDIGTMNSKGIFDHEAGQKYVEEIGKGDQLRLENANKLSDICMKVNDEPVNDGDKGCDRATMMFKCIVDNAPKLGFRVKFDASKLML